MSAEDPSLHVYGTGRVGLAILALARERGVTIAGAWNPRELRRERSALAHGIPIVVSTDPPTVAADLWLIAVPDDAIAAVRTAVEARTAGAPRWRIALSATALAAAVVCALLFVRIPYTVAGGYAGAWPWRFSGTDHYGGLPVELLRRFAEQYPALVNPRALAASGEASVRGTVEGRREQ